MNAVLTAPPRLARHRWWRPALLVVGVAVAAVELNGHVPSAAETWTALSRARTGWLVAAVLLEAVSMTAFGEQQRQLLAAFGVRMSAGVSQAVGYARSAMSTALPGGSAVSAGYAFRQFRARGASQPVAAAVTLLSGVVSVVGLAVLTAGSWVPPSVTLSVVAATVIAWSVWPPRARSAAAGWPPAEAPEPDGVPLVARVGRTLRHTATMARRVPAGRWLGVLALAVVNWLTDVACLLAAAYAVGLAVPTGAVVVAYLAAQLVRQIPLTPGGIGVIEASLVLALTAAGAPAAAAAAAVLIYRLVSCWVLLPVGLICWTVQRPAADPA